MDRRSFMKSAAGVALLAQSGCRSIFPFDRYREGGSMIGFSAPPLGRVRIGVIGLGGRGTAAVRRLARIEGAEIVAVCDLLEDRVARSVKILSDGGAPVPAQFHGGKEEWRRLCDLDNVDLVYICTPWLWHTPMAVQAMKCGKHAAVEVPAAMTVEQCWQLVEVSEGTRRHCMMLENCCYGESELLALNLCRKGVLGELVHGEAAYIHDLRSSKFVKKGRYFEQWRMKWSQQHTGNPYPTHGLGPVCQYMNINRGDRFEYLTSVSSNQFGLSELAREKFGVNSDEAKGLYKLGDMNTSIVKTYRGRTIMVQHDTTSPRPYSRINLISGTKGTLADYPLRVALEPGAHKWMSDEELAKLKEKYQHPLWKQCGERARKDGGHGGMDYIMDLRLVHCLQHGLPLDIDVYDTALWSSLVELTERSVERRGGSVKVPDFTRGGWKRAEPLGIVTL